MNICQWESRVQSGCCVYSQSIKNSNSSTIQSIVYNCFNKIKRSFCINMWQWMKHGSTHFTLESNCLSVEWTAAGENHPKWPKMQTSAGKVLASIFWDVQGILFIDCLEKWRTINSEYYIVLLLHLKEEITKKQPQMKKKKVLFHQDNALCHKLIAMVAKLHELHFKLFPHPPSSPELALTTTGCLQTSEECYRERDLTPMKWYWKLRCILRPKTNCSTKNVLNCWSVGISVSP